METGSVNQEFNIAEILRYAPKMLELFSPIYGEVYFDYVNEEGTDIRVKTKLCGGSVATFNANGTFYDLPNSECLLFPSTHCRTWIHWQNTLFLESIGSVCVDTITGNKFILDHNGTFFSDGTGSQYSTLIDGEDSGNYLLNSRYSTPEEAKEFFEELNKNGYKWNGKMVVEKEDKQKFYVGDNVYKWEDGKGLKKEQNKPKFKEGDLIRNKQTGLCMTIAEVKDDCYYSKAKTRLLFKFQDNWELIYSQKEFSLEVKVSIMADEILALKERVTALEINAIKTQPLTKDPYKDPYLNPNKVTCDDAQCYKGKCVSDVFKTPDKAGDNVTLEEMRNE